MQTQTEIMTNIRFNFRHVLCTIYTIYNMNGRVVSDIQTWVKGDRLYAGPKQHGLEYYKVFHAIRIGVNIPLCKSEEFCIRYTTTA